MWWRYGILNPLSYMSVVLIMTDEPAQVLRIKYIVLSCAPHASFEFRTFSTNNKRPSARIGWQFLLGFLLGILLTVDVLLAHRYRFVGQGGLTGGSMHGLTGTVSFRCGLTRWIDKREYARNTAKTGETYPRSRFETSNRM